jgi:hypothetical protein
LRDKSYFQIQYFSSILGLKITKSPPRNPHSSKAFQQYQGPGFYFKNSPSAKNFAHPQKKNKNEEIK